MDVWTSSTVAASFVSGRASPEARPILESYRNSSRRLAREVPPEPAGFFMPMPGDPGCEVLNYKIHAVIASKVWEHGPNAADPLPFNQVASTLCNLQRLPMLEGSASSAAVFPRKRRPFFKLRSCWSLPGFRQPVQSARIRWASGSRDTIRCAG